VRAISRDISLPTESGSEDACGRRFMIVLATGSVSLRPAA
jgi:hypothetical protein